MNVPRDCKHCRHQNNKEVCKILREGKTCAIPYAGDVFVTDEFDNMTYKKRVEVNKKFLANYGVDIKTKGKKK